MTRLTLLRSAAVWFNAMWMMLLQWSLFVIAGLGRPEAQAKPKLEVSAWTQDTHYRSGQPIRIGIRVTNRSDQELRLDHRIVFHAHVHIVIRDQEGNLVMYPGWNTKIRLAPPHRADDFIRLLPKHFIGVTNVTEDEVVITQKGTYTIYVSYGDAGTAVHGRHLGVAAWSGVVHAPPLRVNVD